MAADELTHLLDDMRRSHQWAFHYFGRDGYRAPDVMACVREWREAWDVVLLREGQPSVAYRVPITDGVDIFAPDAVTWAYGADRPEWTLRAVLTVPDPGDDSAHHRMTPPAACGIPADMRRPVTVRPAAQP